MKILSVDDHAENLYLLEALLRGHGHVVDSASNGVEGLKLAEADRYDAIISDILMPRMDGFQFCRELKKNPRLRSIPFIFFTATYTDPKDAQFALGLGASRFFTKPFEPEQYENEHKRLVLDLVQRKLAGEEVPVAVEEPAAAPVPDLMAALKASIDQAKAAAPAEAAEAEAEEESEPAPKKTAKSSGTGTKPAGKGTKAGGSGKARAASKDAAKNGSRAKSAAKSG